MALPEEKFNKLVAMDSEFYNLERRESAHKTTFKESANVNGYKKIDKQSDIEKEVSSLSPDDGK